MHFAFFCVFNFTDIKKFVSPRSCNNWRHCSSRTYLSESAVTLDRSVQFGNFVRCIPAQPYVRCGSLRSCTVITGVRIKIYGSREITNLFQPARLSFNVCRPPAVIDNQPRSDKRSVNPYTRLHSIVYVASVLFC